MSELVLLSPPTAEGVRTLRLNRPDKANALSAALVDHLHASLDAIGPETLALVIRGEGRNFCAGFDFTGYEQLSEGDLLLRFVRINELLARLRQARFLTIAWVAGAAFGAGDLLPYVPQLVLRSDAVARTKLTTLFGRDLEQCRRIVGDAFLDGVSAAPGLDLQEGLARVPVVTDPHLEPVRAAPRGQQVGVACRGVEVDGCVPELRSSPDVQDPGAGRQAIEYRLGGALV